MGRWFFRFGEEVVPPRLGDGFRSFTVPPSSFTRLLHLTSPPPPRFTMGGIDVRVRSIHDIDMVGREEARVCGRDEGRAQQRGGPAHGSLLLVWGSLAACFPVRLASVAERCLARSNAACRGGLGPLYLRVADRKAGASRRARPPSCGSEASAAGLWPSVEPSRWKHRALVSYMPLAFISGADGLTRIDCQRIATTHKDRTQARREPVPPPLTCTNLPATKVQRRAHACRRETRKSRRRR